MDPRVTKGIAALSAAISAAAGVWFVDDPDAQQMITVFVTFIVGWLIKTPGDIRVHRLPAIERHTP